MISGQLTRLRLLAPASVDGDLLEPVDDAAAALHLRIETLDGRPVGRLEIEAIDPRHLSAEITLSVEPRDSAASDLRRDALAAACRYLLERRMVHRIGLTSPAGDGDTIAAYERLGFRREGILRGYRTVDGKPADEVAMSLLAGDLRG